MGNIIQEVDVSDVIGFLAKKNKTYQAIILSDLEEILDKDSPEYKKVRKLVLDSFNNFFRVILKVIFGYNFEDVIK